MPDLETESGRPSPRQPMHYFSRLAVRSGQRVHVIRIEDIDWMEAAGNYVRIHIGRESYLHRESLTSMESRLDPARFVRIHRSTVVNLERIVQLHPSFRREYVVILRDGRQLTLSGPHRSKLERVIGRF